MWVPPDTKRKGRLPSAGPGPRITAKTRSRSDVQGQGEHLHVDDSGPCAQGVHEPIHLLERMAIVPVEVLDASLDFDRE